MIAIGNMSIEQQQNYLDSSYQLDWATAVRMNRLYMLPLIWVVFAGLGFYAEVSSGQKVGWLLVGVLGFGLTMVFTSGYLRWLKDAGWHALGRRLIYLLPMKLVPDDFDAVLAADIRYFNTRVDVLKAEFRALNKQLGPAWMVVTPGHMQERVRQAQELFSFERLQEQADLLRVRRVQLVEYGRTAY